jgi:nucleoside-diphosphate-sugar epimerase
MARKILITGAAGFIGGALAEELQKDPGNDLLLIDQVEEDRFDLQFAELLKRPNTRYLRMDITDRAATFHLPKDVETVYHLAAIIGVEQVLRSPDKVLEVNAVSTLNVFNYARELPKLRRLLFSSTSEVYAGTLKRCEIALPTPETVLLCIDDVSAPRTSYALSKIYGEAVAFAWRQIHGVPVTIVRYHNVYGPRMGFRHVIPQTFVKIVQSNGVVEVPSPDHTRAFCYIEDAVRATIRCVESEKTEGRIVHIGSSEEEIAIRDLVCRIGRVMGREISIKELPDTPGSPARRCPDTSVLAQLTGYRAKVSLDEGLRRTHDWYKDRI